jgi:hypothetical protein
MYWVLTIKVDQIYDYQKVSQRCLNGYQSQDVSNNLKSEIESIDKPFFLIFIRKNFFARSLMGVYVVLVARIVLLSARSILPGTT